MSTGCKLSKISNLEMNIGFIIWPETFILETCTSYLLAFDCSINNAIESAAWVRGLHMRQAVKSSLKYISGMQGRNILRVITEEHFS